MMDNDFRVYPRHVQACGLCLIPGCRDWGKQHGFDWRSFVKNGVPASEVLAINDSLCAQVVEIARREHKQKAGE